MPTLNIDYAAIIKKADDRRETLQQIEAAMADTPRHMAALVAAIDHFQELAILRNKLDPEGVALTGHVSPAISEVHTALQQARASLTHPKSWLGSKSAMNVLVG